MIKNVVIVGGGTAGWLTAGIVAAGNQSDQGLSLNVTLVESPDVQSIGVGEGTWPTMRTTLKQIGISETDFITSCNASFKQGSKFVGWRTGENSDTYYHPFTLPQTKSSLAFFSAWKKKFPQEAFDTVSSVQGRVCDAFLAPKQITTPEYAGILNYGYHLDAAKFAELLKGHCVNTLGVTHIVDHVNAVENNENGDIAHLKTRHTGDIHGDLFIDCSGGRSLLLGDHYGVPFIDKSKYSPNDRAIAIQVPYSNEADDIASATIATTHSSGWTWDIGLSSRRGVGYVYSGSHISDEKAEIELRRYIAETVGEELASSLDARSIKINCGFRERFWYKNCVAVGMSAGFIEPLEASALALVELSANMIRDELPLTRNTMDVVAKRFNAIFAYRWERIIEFLRLHYVLSRRCDTEYWRDMTEISSAPSALQERLSVWKMRPPYLRDFLQVEEIFPFASYQYVLYGMQYQASPFSRGVSAEELEFARGEISSTLSSVEGYLDNLPSTRKLLVAIHSHGMKKI